MNDFLFCVIFCCQKGSFPAKRPLCRIVGFSHTHKHMHTHAHSHSHTHTHIHTHSL